MYRTQLFLTTQLPWGIYAVFRFGLLQTVLLYTSKYIDLFRKVYFLPFDISPGEKLPGHMVGVLRSLQEVSDCFSQRAGRFAFPPAVKKGSHCHPPHLHHLHQHSLLLLLIYVILTCIKWYLNVVFICLSLMLGIHCFY